MTDANNDDLAAKIESIRQMFLHRLRDEWLPRLNVLNDQLHGDWDKPKLEAAVFLSHCLAGSGATFGYNGISVVAKKVENATRAILHGGDYRNADKDAVLTDIAGLAEECRSAVKDIKPAS